MPSEYVRSPHTVYYIQKPLGKGCWGQVVLAQRREDGMKVALKSALAPDPQHWKRANDMLQDEARAVIRMRHGNIASVLEAFHDSHNQFCVAYEFCSEGDLWDLCSKGGRIDRAWVLDTLVPGILDALHYIDTQHHLVHNDISPANILVKRSRNGKLYPKLNDFGICKPAAILQNTNHFCIWLSPHWRMRGTPASDVYTFLIVVAFCLNLPWSTQPGAPHFREALALWSDADLERMWGTIHRGIAETTPVLRPLRWLFSEPRPGEFNPRTPSEGRAGAAMGFFKQGGRLGGISGGKVEGTESAVRELMYGAPQGF